MSRLIGDRGSGIGDRGSGERVEALLQALAAEDARTAAPPHLESEVMRAWALHLAEPPRRGWDRPWIALAWRAAAVTLAFSALYYSWPGRGAPAGARPSPAEDAAPASAVVAEVGVPLVADPLADPTSLNVMRVRMSRSALANLGLPILDPDAAGVVDVEVLVGEDGVARSIRRAAFAEMRVIEE